MDWHFEEKKLRDGKAVRSRQWFAPADSWVKSKPVDSLIQINQPPAFFEAEAKEDSEEQVVSRVPADDDQPACPLCGDEFVIDFDDESEKWMCEESMHAQVMDIAAGVPVSKIVHVKCYTPGTVPVITMFSPRSAPTSPDFHSAPKRPLEAPVMEQEPAAKRVKSEPDLAPLVDIKPEPV
eukprot:TRINITY_DN51319_c0_g1_i2.p1 TRINITY_DN51319_c0_g1~~TRINITY_DN51319_c0_g1_i2.p1  ORF type:complete len:180 (+),score=43.47 TRINITY_DN51319_c0_g1_i2:445-984(+)